MLTSHRRALRASIGQLFLSGLVAASLSACSSQRGSGAGHGDGGSGGDMNPLGQLTQIVIGPDTPADAPTKFGGPQDPSAAPTVVYPADGVIMPPNLSELEVQWTPGAGTKLFELRFVSTYLDLTIYTVCKPIGTGCGFLPDEATWALMSQQSRGDTMKLTVRGTSGGGGVVGAAAARSISFTDEDLLGGLYYWAASAGTIARYDFGKRGQSAEVFYNASEAGALCVGCHSLARNGERIAVGLNAPVPTAGLRVLDIATKGKMFDRGSMFGGGSNFEAFSPDGMRILVNAGSDLLLLDANTGNQVGTAAAILNGNLPDWSADSSKVTFARSGASGCPLGLCGSIPGVAGADLYTVDVSGDTFGAPQMIVTGGGNNFYPTYAPDGSVIAFNRSVSNASSFDAPDARVWVVGATGGTPVALTNASATGADVGDSWPKFAPFSHHWKGETIFWLTFSSRRDYGLRLINHDKIPTMGSDGSTNDPRIAQVWMVGVPASAIHSGAMPAGGYPAFWLPFQSMASGNHIAQWTEKIARQPCNQIDANPCPQGEECENGACVGVPVL